MILAEKLVTALQRGVANTRWRDFADVYLLTGRHASRSQEVHESVRRVALSRKAPLQPLENVLVGYAALAQPRWSVWVRKQSMQSQLPVLFSVVLDGAHAFAAPLFETQVRSLLWNPERRRWIEPDSA